MSAFEVLNKINVNGHTEERNGLTYLSWSWAWAEVKKAFPDASYRIWKDEQNRPYICDPSLGYMVFTEMTIDGQTHEMWLPVMDTNNKAMKSEPYTISTKYKDITVPAATMFDINKAIMRCLVKNAAMFGLGLYVYSGEDLPEVEKIAQAEEQATPILAVEALRLKKMCEEDGVNEAFVASLYKRQTVEELDQRRCLNAIDHWTEIKKKYVGE